MKAGRDARPLVIPANAGIHPLSRLRERVGVRGFCLCIRIRRRAALIRPSGTFSRRREKGRSGVQRQLLRQRRILQIPQALPVPLRPVRHLGLALDPLVDRPALLGNFS